MSFEVTPEANPDGASFTDEARYAQSQHVLGLVFGDDPRLEGITEAGQTAVTDLIYGYFNDTLEDEDFAGAAAVSAFIDWAEGNCTLEEITESKYDGDSSTAMEALFGIVTIVRQRLGPDGGDVLGLVPEELLAPRAAKRPPHKRRAKQNGEEVPKKQPEVSEPPVEAVSEPETAAETNDEQTTEAGSTTKRRPRQPRPPKTPPIESVTSTEVELLRRKARARVGRLVRPTWEDEALCRYMDTKRLDELFFPPRKNAAIFRETGKICLGCDVREQCLARALANNDEGYLAGTTKEQRAAMR